MTPEQEGRALAAALRDEHNLGVAPIADLTEFVETTLGIDVAVLTMPRDLSGLTQRDPRSGRLVIAIATGTSYEHQRFSLAHELGHVRADAFSADLASVHRRSRSERVANSFAGHFLAPIDGITALPKTADRFELMSDIVRRFRISPEAAAIQLSLADPSLTGSVKRELEAKTVAWYATKYGWDAELADLAHTAGHQRPPQRLLANAMDAYQQGYLSIAVLARLKFQTEAETLAELQNVGLVAPEQPATQSPRSGFDVNSDW